MLVLKRIQVLAVFVFITVLNISCGHVSGDDDKAVKQIDTALDRIGQGSDDISLPKLPYPVSTRGRLEVVNTVLASPPKAIGLGADLKGVSFAGDRKRYLDELFEKLMPYEGHFDTEVLDEGDPDVVWDELLKASGEEVSHQKPAPGWHDSSAAAEAVRVISMNIVRVRRLWDQYGGQASDAELNAIKGHLASSLVYTGVEVQNIFPDMGEYHDIGQRVDIAALFRALTQLFGAIETVLPELSQAKISREYIDWDTPLGIIRIAGKQANEHKGGFLLLIDLGGDDTYIDVGSDLTPGQVSVVIDLAGNDHVTWSQSTGPGSGVLGMGIWMDLQGNDKYTGGNQGLGASLFGAGIFWDEAGDDTYEAGFLSQGVGQYGVGIFVDYGGNDHYRSGMAGQGFGGVGGIGVLVDFAGDDTYVCGGAVPDPVTARARRHQGDHYLSMCQGSSSGQRPDVSGGVGVLLDRAGHDTYEADIFGQGSAYWFGLGMLLDGAGNDRYSGYEHCQGEGLHLAAGFLGDWGGDDEYQGYEHCQGVGKDRAAGILYEVAGNDAYWSHHESQGAGLDSFGVGILLDVKGDDKYEALRDAQGYARPFASSPDTEWPIGILLDLAGDDTFVLPYSDPFNELGRIQNRQGIAIDQ